MNTSNIIPLMNTPSATLTVPTKGLMALLGCGKPTAVKIGLDAGAKVVVGERKILWNVRMIQRYLDTAAQ